MILRTGLMFAGGMAIAGCTNVEDKPPLPKSVFLSIAQRCNAKNVSFEGDEDTVPTIGFADTMTQIGNRRVRVADCIANDIRPYRIGKISIGKPRATDTRTD